MTATLFDFPAPKPVKPKATGKKPKYTERFEREVWGPYPRKNGTSKVAAFRKFGKLDDEDQEALIRAIPIYTRQKQGSEECYICHLEFFISRRLFETIGIPATVPGAPAAEIDWRRVMPLYEKTGRWNVDLGNPPGSIGCRVPAEVLKAFGY